MLRIRDFIETKEKLIFAVTSYYHPRDKYLAFLRYYPSKSGRRKRCGEKFKKVASTQESFKFLEKKFPEHLFLSEVTTPKLQCVPKEKISKIYCPSERLKEIYEKPRDALEQKVVALSELFSEIQRNKKGVSGSILLNLHEKNSDIDFVVYGIKNHEKAREKLKQLFEEEKVRPLSKKEWYNAYRKRFPGSALSFEEFLWHEQRKLHKGVIDGTIFDILLVRDFEEIREKYSDKRFRRLEKVRIKCTVTDASLAFDSPAIYKVECGDGRIKEVASFTHTYAGQAFDGEEIEVAGFLEEVSGKENYFRVVVGTTREAEGEHIKIKGLR